jgi:hypothetical protein
MPLVSVVTGTELLSRGNRAGSSFRELLDSAKSWRAFRSLRPAIIVIDDADDLITARINDFHGGNDPCSGGYSSENSTAHSEVQLDCKHSSSDVGVLLVHCCLYLLLEAIRESNKFMSVILTTSLKFENVDRAVRDR